MTPLPPLTGRLPLWLSLGAVFLAWVGCGVGAVLLLRRWRNGTGRGLAEADWPALLDALPVPLWVRGPGGELVWINRAYAALLGRQPDASVQQPCTDLSANREGQGLGQQAVQAGSAVTRAHYVVADGQRWFYRFHEAPVLRAGVTTGLAEDRTREAALERDLERLRAAQSALLDHLSAGIAVYESDRRLTYANIRFAALFGLDEAWLATGPAFDDVLEMLRARGRLPETPDWPRYRREQLDLFRTLDQPREDMWYLPNGQVFRVLALAHSVGGIVFTVEDVSDVLALEVSYNTLLDVQRETLDDLAESVVVFGADGRLRLANPAFLALFGLAGADFGEEMHVRDLIALIRQGPLGDDTSPGSSVGELLLSLALERRDNEGRLRLPLGVELDFVSVPLPDGSILIRFLNVTDTVRVERALRERADALEAIDQLKSEFLGNVSLRFQAPLAAITTHARGLSLAAPGALDPEQARAAHGIVEAAGQLTGMIGDIIDLSTIDQGQLELNLSLIEGAAMVTALGEQVSAIAHQAGVYYRAACGSEVGPFAADRDRLQQSLYRLVLGAIETTAAGRYVDLVFAREGDWVVIMVGDDGAHASAAGQMLLPQTTDATIRAGAASPQAGQARLGQAGLGLSSIRTLIELHGGMINTRSSSLGGMLVKIHLPGASPLPPPLPPPLPSLAGGAP